MDKVDYRIKIEELEAMGPAGKRVLNFFIKEYEERYGQDDFIRQYDEYAEEPNERPYIIESPPDLG